MTRTLSPARSLSPARTASSARTLQGAYRMPTALVDMGLTHYWDFSTNKLGTNSFRVSDRIGGMDLDYKGTTAINTAYAIDGYNIDLERSNSDYLATVPIILSKTITSLTVFAWVKIESTASTRHILSQWETSGNQRGFSFKLTATDNIEFALSSNGTAQAVYDSTETLVDTAAYHLLIASYDTTNRTQIWVDGVAQTMTLTSGSHPSSINSSPVAILIGSQIPSALVNFWDGLIGISGIFLNKVLSTTERATLRSLTGTLGGYL